MSTDVVPDVLREIRLTGALYFSVDVGATSPRRRSRPPRAPPHVLPGVQRWACCRPRGDGARAERPRRRRSAESTGRTDTEHRPEWAPGPQSRGERI
jgi:hypothetical protein